MARPKGSKNKPKVESSTKKRGSAVKTTPTTEAPKRPRGRPVGSTKKKSATVPKKAKPVFKDEKVLPNTDFEDMELDYSNVKITELPYMGPDANDDEQFIKNQIIGSRKWNEEDFGGNFSINVDELY